MNLRMCPDCDKTNITKTQGETSFIFRCCDCAVEWEEGSSYDEWAQEEYRKNVRGDGGE